MAHAEGCEHRCASLPPHLDRCRLAAIRQLLGRPVRNRGGRVQRPALRQLPAAEAGLMDRR